LQTKNGRAFSVIGKHVADVFSILDDICTILHWKEREKNNLLDIYKLLRIAIDYQPEKDEQEWFKNNAQSICKRFMEVFPGKAFNYLHVLSVHMVQDMTMYGTVGIFSCSSIESFNGI
jgi:hypothetical protein